MDGQGNQALAWAAEAGLTATVEALLLRGADWRHRNLLGLSALDLAVAAQAAASARAKGAAPETGANAKKSDFKAVISLLQAQQSQTVPYKLPGLVLAIEGGHGLPSLNGPTLLPGIHGHPIERSSRTNDWRCDGCQSQGHSGARYRSIGSACDFDLCQSCWDAACVFKWDDVRVAAAASKTAADEEPPLLSMHAVASEGFHQLPEAWRHDGWLPASSRCRNSSRCGFPYLRLDANTVLRSNGPMVVGTVFLVVRFPANPGASAPAAAATDRAHGAGSTAAAVGTTARAGAEGPAGAGGAEGNSGGGGRGALAQVPSGRASAAGADGGRAARDMQCVIDVGAPRHLVQASEDRSLVDQAQTAQGTTGAQAPVSVGSAPAGGNGRRQDSTTAATVALSAAARTVAGVQMMADAGLMHSRANSSSASAGTAPRPWTPSRHVLTAYASTSTGTDPPPPQRNVGVNGSAAAAGAAAAADAGFGGAGVGGGTVGGTVEQSLQPTARRWGAGGGGGWSGHVPPAPSSAPSRPGERGEGDRQLTSERVEAARGGGRANAPASREGDRERERERESARGRPRLGVLQRRSTAAGGGASGARAEGETRSSEDSEVLSLAPPTPVFALLGFIVGTLPCDPPSFNKQRSTKL